ncbi:hypothetical protein [Spirillospora sp. NBC_01491]|uniref:hypothetical protein n=1 Tax=Spirillospora sp. NBC_01491 TaxID=2976007 RepID=UPI002E34C225|nr:hypothetical protein [Spirillospora sp. NBC_01491]
MPGARTGPLRKALNVPLAEVAIAAFELSRPDGAAVSLIAVFQDASGGCLATVADDHGVMVDLAAPPAGTDRIVLAAETASGPLSRFGGLRCTLRDGASADLAVLSGAAAGETTPEPVHLLGECYRRGTGWWFREIGHGLPDAAAIVRTLGAGAAEYHRIREAAAAVAAATAASASASADGTRPASSGTARALPPANLASARIAGERRARGPVSLEVAVDLSVSMRAHARPRKAALRALADFARREMADGDLLTSVAFAGRAAVMVPPADVRGLPQVTDKALGDVGQGTLLAPALELLLELRAQRPAEPGACSLMVITDASLFDAPSTLSALLRRAGHGAVHLVVPRSTRRRLPLKGHDWADRATVWRFRDADQLGLIYGEVFAAMTGQRLEIRRPHP